MDATNEEETALNEAAHAIEEEEALDLRMQTALDEATRAIDEVEVTLHAQRTVNRKYSKQKIILI